MTYVEGYCATNDDNIPTDTIDIGYGNLLVITATTMMVCDKTFKVIDGKQIDDSLLSSNNPIYNFIYRMFTMNTGGNCMVDVLMLTDGRYIAVTDEIVALYPKALSDEAFLQDCDGIVTIEL